MCFISFGERYTLENVAWAGDVACGTYTGGAWIREDVVDFNGTAAAAVIPLENAAAHAFRSNFVAPPLRRCDALV